MEENKKKTYNFRVKSFLLFLHEFLRKCLNEKNRKNRKTDTQIKKRQF